MAWAIKIRDRLTGLSDSAGLDAQVILARLLGRSRSWVLAHPELSLTIDQEDRLNQWLQRLEADEPLPYVLGEWEFYGMDFFLSPAVLIPRPETELLVERALGWLKEQPGRRGAADVGTGSGCIAVTLAANCPDLSVTASDISFEALRVARSNAARYGLDGRICCVHADLIPAVVDTFDLIAANLPYIPSQDLDGLKVVKWEPHLALDGGPDGLRPIKKLLDQLPGRLAAGGLTLLEIEARQGAAVKAAALARFPFAAVDVLPDLAGFDRLISIQSRE